MEGKAQYLRKNGFLIRIQRLEIDSGNLFRINYILIRIARGCYSKCYNTSLSGRE